MDGQTNKRIIQQNGATGSNIKARIIPKPKESGFGYRNKCF